MSRRKRTPPAVLEGRRLCEFEFEPLWKPAPWTPIDRTPDLLGASDLLRRADLQAAAKRTAFAWLAVRLGAPAFDSFDAIDDVELLRRAYAIIWNASITDVRRWADAREAEAA